MYAEGEVRSHPRGHRPWGGCFGFGDQTPSAAAPAERPSQLGLRRRTGEGGFSFALRGYCCWSTLWCPFGNCRGIALVSIAIRFVFGWFMLCSIYRVMRLFRLSDYMFFTLPGMLGSNDWCRKRVWMCWRFNWGSMYDTSGLYFGGHIKVIMKFSGRYWEWVLCVHFSSVFVWKLIMCICAGFYGSDSSQNWMKRSVVSHLIVWN